MERADGNRRMWLLKSTSDHHRPECLAAAMALGILAGLVPKLNLLALVLYGLILILPVHTLLAVIVSVAVAMLSFQLDATAHAVGSWLLRQTTLQSLWASLERVPLVPWMSLHNTVVLGHLVIGTLLFAPVYLVSWRIFERIEYGGQARRGTANKAIQSYAPVTQEETEPLITRQEPYPNRDGTPEHRRSELPKPQESTVDRSPLIIPPPKLHRAVAKSDDQQRLNAPDDPILFDPIDDVEQRINAWHMNHAPGEAEYATTESKRKSLTESSQARASNSDAASTAAVDSFFPQMTAATEASTRGRADQRLGDKSTTDKLAASQSLAGSLSADNLPAAPQRPEGVLSSLQVAQSANEVLAWVDDLLDECMAEEGMMLVTPDVEADSKFNYDSHANVHRDMANDRGTQPRWLLETTIEIVRLTDETMSDQALVAEQSMDYQVQPDLSQPRSTENTVVMPAESMTRAWPGVGGSVASSSGSIDAALPMQDAGEPTILNLNQAAGRGASENRTGFQELVMASINKDIEPRATLPIEPVKGECLAYLLGHLRQTREGKSS